MLTTPDTAATSLKEFIPEFIDALTRPATAEEKWSGTFAPPAPPRIALTGNYDEIQSYFEGDLSRFRYVAPIGLMTDGLPVVPPTEEKVARMLTGTSHSPDEVIEIRSHRGDVLVATATVEKVAVNAVMAGCKPEYFPIVLAMAEFGGCQGAASDSSQGHFFVVSGPIAKEIGMNSGMSYLTPGNPANMALERAAILIGINLAGTVIGVTSNGRFGNFLWGLTFADSPDSPWEGLNVDQGYNADQSILIGFVGCAWITPYNTAEVMIAQDLRELQVSDPEHAVAALKTHKKNMTSCMLFFTPDTAKKWHDEYGFETMQQLQDYLWDNVTYTAGEWRSTYWFYSSEPTAKKNPPGTRMINPDHLAAPDDAQVPIVVSPELIKIIVAGGDGDGWGWGGSGYGRLARNDVLIDKWR